jgi:hypothetical protein
MWEPIVPFRFCLNIFWETKIRNSYQSLNKVIKQYIELNIQEVINFEIVTSI